MIKAYLVSFTKIIGICTCAVEEELQKASYVCVTFKFLTFLLLEGTTQWKNINENDKNTTTSIVFRHLT